MGAEVTSMKNPIAVGEKLLRDVEEAMAHKLVVSWDDFYKHIGDEGVYVTEFYIERMNAVLQPKGFQTFKSSHGLVVRSIK